MAIRMLKELAVEILHVKDGDSYYLQIMEYTTWPKLKESISQSISFIPVKQSHADEVFKALKLTAIEREDKSGTNYRGKAWLRQQEYRNNRVKQVKK